MNQHQAGVGPGQDKVHIYVLGQLNFRMSLCGAVNVVRNYRADVVFNHPKMCRRCALKFLQDVPNPVASDLGVSELRFN